MKILQASFLKNVLAPIALLSACGSQNPQATTPASPGAAIDLGNEASASILSDFGFSLYGIAKPASGNFSISPVSLASALAMTAEGAHGETRREMIAALKLQSSQLESYSQSIGHWSRNLSEGAATVRSANRLYLEQTYTLQDAFRGRMQSVFASPTELIDFRSHAEAARTNINAWVSQQTETKIDEILPTGSVNGDTRLVLVNALYFLGQWKTAFNAELTETLPFHPLEGNEQPPQVPTMRQTNVQALYGENDQAQILTLAYEGDRYAMQFVLPREFQAFEGQLNNQSFASLQSTQAMQAVDIFLPRFKIEGEPVQMNAALEQMGMRRAFSENDADFSAMSASNDLYVGGVYHRTFVEVNERGTEAAAATGVVMQTRSMPMAPRPRPVFRADKPFFFVLRDLQSGFPLFIGRVTNPSA